ncbi:hypothetical protein AQUCO_00300616v1 [Aquilegia coerulea]|uniref:Uncharacterized protein n=1 Tax=Aquilegia coerulea TaxID=218851 RepID=A0A2G5EZQ0_AQUCA|nr:hypothetical protein AQUCO_00300616v1 [Aquilegia coerulea]
MYICLGFQNVDARDAFMFDAYLYGIFNSLDNIFLESEACLTFVPFGFLQIVCYFCTPSQYSGIYSSIAC